MAVTLVDTGSTDSPPAYTDDENTMYLQSREPSRSGSTRSTREVWKGATAAALEFYLERVNDPLISDISTSQNGAAMEVSITWTVDLVASDGDEEPQEGVVWSWDFIEIPTPIAAHPYFQQTYVDGSGEIIEDEIARCEAAIKRGRPYTASGAYKWYTARYYALRMAGVEEYNQHGVELRKSYSTSDDGELDDAHSGTGLVSLIAGTGAPAKVRKALEKLKKIKGYGSNDPSSVEFDAASFEFLKRTPSCSYNTTADNDRVDVVESWLGVQQWSFVLYPSGDDAPADRERWDPIGEVEADA